MSDRTWRDWSCAVRVVVGQDDAVAAAIVDDAAAIVERLMADVGRAVSRFRVDSELAQVNEAAPRLHPVGPLALALVEKALETARRTDGAVDPTIGRHITAWGYDADIETIRSTGIPRTTETRSCARSDWRKVALDRDLGRIGIARGLRLDVGATAKAWTVDEAARRVADRYRRPVLVEIGGDVAVAGPTEIPWSVRVAEIADGPGEVVGLTFGGLATSSVVARRWSTTAGEAHHIIDPRTGAPTDGSVRTATVWAPSCLMANTFSTAALVWGGEAAERLEHAGVPARLITDSGTVVAVGAWPSGERAA